MNSPIFQRLKLAAQVVFKSVAPFPFNRLLPYDATGGEKMYAPYKQSAWVQRAIKKVAGPISAVDLRFSLDGQPFTANGIDDFWRFPAAGTPVIQIGIDASDLGRNYPNAVPLFGDAKATLAALAGETARRDSWIAETKATVNAWRSEAQALRNSDAAPLRPERILKELSDWLPEDALVVCDTGHAGMWCAQQLWINSRRWDFIRAAGSLGWAFPASLGAKCAVPDRPVVCFTGDGGFWYHLQELETAVRCGINTVTCVNNNRSLNQETPIFEAAYGGKPSNRQGEMWQFTPVNFARVAESMGAVGIRVEKPSELRPALDRAFSCGKPAVVDVASDIAALAPTAWSG